MIGRAATRTLTFEKYRPLKQNPCRLVAYLKKFTNKTLPESFFFLKDSPIEYISPSICFSIMAAKYEKSLFAKFGDTYT